jgi:hypothetical protein
MLIDDDIENVFPSSYAWWTATERKCWGDGTSATRRTVEKPGGQPWTPCGSGCPELSAGQCKPGGDLRFVLADFPRPGSVCRIHTSSYRSIRQIHSALQEIQTFTGGRLAGITGKLVVRPEEVSYFDRKEKKKIASIWALSLEVDGDDARKLIANLTENARLFAETRKLLGSGGKVFEVVEDEQEQAPEIAAEFYPAPANRSSAGEAAAAVASPPRDATPAGATPKQPTKPLSPGNGAASNGVNGSGRPPADRTTPPPAHDIGNGSSAGSGFNQLRNEFLTARRVATNQKRPIGEVVEWASGGASKYAAIGRMTEADTPKLRAANELIASALGGTARRSASFPPLQFAWSQRLPYAYGQLPTAPQTLSQILPHAGALAYRRALRVRRVACAPALTLSL